MKINELKLVYFSPTGATRKIMMETARNIDAKSVSFDFSVYKAKKPSLKFGSNDFAIFGIPVYYGRVPHFSWNTCRISQETIHRPLLPPHTDAGNTKTLFWNLKTELEGKGFKVIAAAAFPTEHSIIPMIGARRPNKADLRQASEYGIELTAG